MDGRRCKTVGVQPAQLDQRLEELKLLICMGLCSAETELTLAVKMLLDMGRAANFQMRRIFVQATLRALRACKTEHNNPSSPSVDPEL
jgi:hypothetical protein